MCPCAHVPISLDVHLILSLMSVRLETQLRVTYAYAYALKSPSLLI